MKQRPSHRELIRENPWKLVRSLYYTLVYLVLVVQNRLLLPFACRAVDIRTELARCYLAAFLGNFWDLIFKAPPWLRKDQYSEIAVKGVPAVLVPPNTPLGGNTSGSKPDNRRKAYLLYAHGGGYLFGEPLMYISTYERWIDKASHQGLDLVIVSVDYALADESKWPACRDDFIRAYEGLVHDHQIDPSSIIFGGDSAGGGLVAMSALEIGRRNLPMPGGLLLISPWLDLVMESTLQSPAMSTDFLVTFTKDNPELVKMFLPDGMSPADPRVSPIFDDLKGLPPQLVLAGTAEVLLPDSKEWTRRSLEAGNNVKFVLEPGQMHIYAIGSPFCSKAVESKTDKSIIQFFKDYRDIAPKKFQ